uniref:Transmembrane and coiled-coil domain family 1 n=1 Tax=Sinocyclocheilus rhinocerous TaxID=307959 RepID=A0A673HBA5_9TELE
MFLCIGIITKHEQYYITSCLSFNIHSKSEWLRSFNKALVCLMQLSLADGSLLGSEDGGLDPQRTRQAIAQLQQKILKLTEQLRIEQAARDENVAEYLKLASNASDKQQSSRIKQVFEKKNQKSAASIAQLQRKLEHYHRRLREVEHSGVQRQPKDMLRDMQQGLRDVGARVITGLSEGVVDSVKGGLSSFSHVTHSAAGAVASKPREIASLIRHRFGSADNISVLKDGPEDAEDGVAAAGRSLGSAGGHLQSSPKFGSDEDCSSATSGSVGANSVTGAPGGPPSSRGNTLERGHSGSLDMLLQELQELRDAQTRLEETVEQRELKCLIKSFTIPSSLNLLPRSCFDFLSPLLFHTPPHCLHLQVFEKKNQKSAASIAQLQRKLEHYHRRLREVEHSGVQRQPKDMLRDMQQGLRDVGARVITGLSEGVVDSVKGGLSSFSHVTHSAAGAVASKPREIASLIRHRFGSADNISVLKDGPEDAEDGVAAAGRSLGSAGGHLQSSPKFGSDEDCSSATSGSVGANSVTGAPGGPPRSRGVLITSAC